MLILVTLKAVMGGGDFSSEVSDVTCQEKPGVNASVLRTANRRRWSGGSLGGGEEAAVELDK